MVKVSEKEIIERMNEELYLFHYSNIIASNIQYLFEGVLACVFDIYIFFGCRNFGL